ncbi:DNA primase, eukaryotic-type, small subunit [Saprolegnia diclina VS20]|uniref:DNA primase n=1 Tax=Saprolegnia diclina (strain VS20) TaxID=1156394 RepID=T0RT25_SAPDV|nr:DNA primase, eukaryotic-type, small subunit [Saprolegnia diclina VS20]EQC35568.1 DNA primase, eukaryotic-type, small subunit [Saprolegnia diclina VS20]|eukprot:XP_008610885.1 DNA primase, eukaryotic-type, small subunit [Saprolegnia diclina VS20]
MVNESFSPELLGLYYDRLFPYELMTKWLGYDCSMDKGGPGTELLSRREFSFTLENDVYIRYKAFRDADEFKAEMKKLMPFKIDIGAVFTVSPADKGKVDASKFVPEERELVFDVDLTDYDDVRTCCQDAKICARCWRFMVAAVKVLDTALREDFGFQHLMWVYSGRRGIHCWVSDYTARMLTNDARSAVVQYLTTVEGNENTKRKVVLRDPLHPSLERAYTILEPLFHDIILSDDGQGILSSPEHWKKLLEMVPDEDMRATFHNKWLKNPNEPPATKWASLKAAIHEALTSKKRKQLGDDKRRLLGTCIAEIVFAYLYPRLDANVSKQRNHLLKSPFAVHPKTGRVCVPIDPRKIDTFDPDTVPTLADLERQLNGEETKHVKPFADYTKLFDAKFIHPIQLALIKQKKVLAETQAAATGDW